LLIFGKNESELKFSIFRELECTEAKDVCGGFTPSCPEGT
jgi:hypothetical protein